MTAKTVLAAGAMLGLACVTWAVCAPGGPESAKKPGVLPKNAAREAEVRSDRQQPVASTQTASEAARSASPPEARPVADADRAPPSELDEARARLDRITTRMREARDDPSSLSNEERQALFAEGMAAYDTMRAQATLAGPEAKAELEALYPEFRELMLAVKPPPPKAPLPDADGG